MILLHTRSQLQCFAAAARQARIIHDGGPGTGMGMRTSVGWLTDGIGTSWPRPHG